MLEVLDAVISVWGADRVGLRISPLNSYNSMIDSDPVAITTYIAQQCSARGIAYLHVMRSRFLPGAAGRCDDASPRCFQRRARRQHGLHRRRSRSKRSPLGKLDAVAFGTSFLANPDLPARIAAKAELNAPDAARFYSPGPKGYTDYPALSAA
jgi:N-ethylmaleimide reductase